jgi:hypothetical protein
VPAVLPAPVFFQTRGVQSLALNAASDVYCQMFIDCKGLFVMNRYFNHADLNHVDSRAVCRLALLAIVLVSNWAQAQTCNPNTARTAPDTRYSAVNDGAEVKDSVTRLIWQRCSLGQRWNGKTCLGTAAAHSWAKAQEAAGVVAAGVSEGEATSATAPGAVASTSPSPSPSPSPSTPTTSTPASAPPKSSTPSWRLPTHKELYTLVEKACRNPAINTVWFPATRDNFHWSASPLSDDDSFAWGVDFSDGRGGYDAKVGAYSVRLVRAEQQ